MRKIVLVCAMCDRILWMLGIHGGMLMYAALGSVRSGASMANMAAFAAGESVPYLEWGLTTMCLDLGVLALTVLLLTSLVMRIGIVPPITGVGLSNVIPVPIAMWMSTNSIRGLLWGVILIVIDVALFFPFFKVAEKMAVKQEAEEEKQSEAQNA